MESDASKPDSTHSTLGPAVNGEAELDGEGVPASGERSAGATLETMARRDVYTRPMLGGRVVDGPLSKAVAWLRTHVTTELHRREQELDAQLDALSGVTRTNQVAVVSPKGGVGKTTTTFILGSILASRLKLRVVAVDANPDFGTLAALVPDERRSKRSLADLLADRKLHTSSELTAYVSRLPTGLHILGAPPRVEVMSEMTPGLYEKLLEQLSRFYEVILLDLGTGITDPIAKFAIQSSDQLVVITTPEWVTSASVLGALRYLATDIDGKIADRIGDLVDNIGKGEKPY